MILCLNVVLIYDSDMFCQNNHTLCDIHVKLTQTIDRKSTMLNRSGSLNTYIYIM